jgi:hypothetical protein
MPHAVTLTCHPATPTDVVRGIAARVSRHPAGMLAVRYVLEGDLDRVRVPPPRAPRVAAKLWQHTCCEIFVARKGSPAYHEFNLSPSGEWAAYAFDAYRAPTPGAADAAVVAPRVAVRGTAERLELDAEIRLDQLPEGHAGSKLMLGLSAVIEDNRGELSYWALRHPRGKPDFHHAEAFALELDE